MESFEGQALSFNGFLGYYKAVRVFRSKSDNNFIDFEQFKEILDS